MTLNMEEVRTNIPLLDHQHQKYFDAVDRLLEHCKEKEPDMSVIDEILVQTQEYAVDNFDTEEYLMELEAYPDTEQHKQKHELFKGRLDSYTEQINAEKVNLRDAAKRLRALLVGWFNNQIKDDDMRLAAFLHRRQKRET